MKSLVVLRVVAVTHAAAACLQPVLAGSYLSGQGAAMRMHEPVGLGLAFVALTQLLTAMIYWRSGGPGWPALLSLAVVAAESVQISMGFARELAVHIPLGVGIVMTALVFAGWTFRPAARVRRTAKTEAVAA
jgi:hypothetical protein